MNQKAIYNKIYYERTKQQNELKQKQLDYGLKVEEDAIPILNHYFTDNLIKTSNKYCKYDYTGLNSSYIYELKSNMYSINQYNNAVIDKKKIESFKYIHNLLLVFSYLEPNGDTDYYYIKFNYESFIKNFNERTIALKRGYDNIILDIPTDRLIPIDINNPINITGTFLEVPYIK